MVPHHSYVSTSDPSNYRAISVVSVVAKMLEKIVSTQLLSYLEYHQLLHPHQGPTEDILLVSVDTTVHHLDKGKSICAAFLYL